MDKDILFNKIQTIERCINRINEVYANNPDNLKIVEMIIKNHLDDFKRFTY